MPYKHKDMLIKPEDDKRVKLIEVQRNEIVEKYGKISQRKLALEYGVSRRTIQFIGDPDKLKKNLKARAERGGSKIYYDKDKHTQAMKTHRTHKQDLYINGNLLAKGNA